MATKHTERTTRTSQGATKQPKPKHKDEPRKAAPRAGAPGPDEPVEPDERPVGKSEHSKPSTSSK